MDHHAPSAHLSKRGSGRCYIELAEKRSEKRLFGVDAKQVIVTSDCSESRTLVALFRLSRIWCLDQPFPMLFLIHVLTVPFINDFAQE